MCSVSRDNSASKREDAMTLGPRAWSYFACMIYLIDERRAGRADARVLRYRFTASNLRMRLCRGAAVLASPAISAMFAMRLGRLRLRPVHHLLRTAGTRMQHSASESYAASTYPPLPPIPHSEHIAGMVMREWATFGEQPAIIDGTTGATRTYAELTAGVDALAAHLAGLGLTPGQLVALVSPNDLDYATVLLAALKLGLTVSPMNPTLTADEMEVQLRDAHIAMVVGSPLCPQALSCAHATCTCNIHVCMCTCTRDVHVHVSCVCVMRTCTARVHAVV